MGPAIKRDKKVTHIELTAKARKPNLPDNGRQSLDKSKSDQD
jgi:hypothetical protein